MTLAQSIRKIVEDTTKKSNRSSDYITITARNLEQRDFTVKENNMIASSGGNSLYYYDNWRTHWRLSLSNFARVTELTRNCILRPVIQATYYTSLRGKRTISSDVALSIWQVKDRSKSCQDDHLEVNALQPCQHECYGYQTVRTSKPRFWIFAKKNPKNLEIFQKWLCEKFSADHLQKLSLRVFFRYKPTEKILADLIRKISWNANAADITPKKTKTENFQ